METYNYVHCPNILCDARLGTDWEFYQVEDTKDGEAQYKCPYCGFQFTNDCTSHACYPVGRDDCHVVLLRKREDAESDELNFGNYFPISAVPNHLMVVVGGVIYAHIHRNQLDKDSRIILVSKSIDKDHIVDEVSKAMEEEWKLTIDK